MPASHSFARLDRTFRSIAVVVGVMAGIGIPASFGLVAYYAQVSSLTYRTGLAADRLAEYIYVQGKTWRFNEHRIADMIGFTRVDGHQTVYDSAERHVADIGTPLSGPSLRVASPIVVHGETVGKVEAAVSLLPLLMQIGALAILGLALGGAVFFGALFIPQRALREATAAHGEVQRNLRLQIDETQSALMAAKEATNAKSAFLAMMSHEIRTPMNAVMGLSSALLESRLDSEQRHLVDTIYDSSNSLLRLLNDILDFSKLDAGKIELESIPFSPAALLDHAVSIVAAKAAEKGLSIRAVTEPGLPPMLLGDPARLQQVMLNLAVNAIKFTENGAIEIGARCLHQKAGAATIECWVRDTGIGIAPEHIDRLFGEFSQAELSTSRRFGGTGLGLAISKRIIERMQGKIDVVSAPAAGSTFSFRVTLPKANAAAAHDAAPPPAGGDFATALSRLARPLLVLLAEDNGTNQLVFSKLMQGFDVELAVAADGREALERARTELFDIVFMDMRMPVMDGLDATRAIRALGGAWSRIPIVALTANAFPEDVKACRDAGMNDFIAKPIRKKVLVERMAAMLADHPLLRAACEMAAITEMPATVGSTTGGTHAPVLAHEIFDELMEVMGRDGIRQMFDGFVDETDRRLGLLRGLSCERDRVRIKEEAHTLKGAAGASGLLQLSELAKTLEQSAATMASLKYLSLVKSLDAGFAAGRAAFDRALSKVAA
jgi:signal transduction histidine kinase/DNA-binding NarL/FixJ family response regulator/HPt (histidine-containing phosphotransfer) domain-containing protein